MYWLAFNPLQTNLNTSALTKKTKKVRFKALTTNNEDEISKVVANEVTCHNFLTCHFLSIELTESQWERDSYNDLLSCYES